MSFEEAVATWIRGQMDPEWAHWNKNAFEAARVAIIDRARTFEDLRELNAARSMLALTGRVDWPPETVPERMRRLLDEMWDGDALVSKLEQLAGSLPYPASEGAAQALELARAHAKRNLRPNVIKAERDDTINKGVK